LALAADLFQRPHTRFRSLQLAIGTNLLGPVGGEDQGRAHVDLTDTGKKLLPGAGASSAKKQASSAESRVLLRDGQPRRSLDLARHHLQITLFEPEHWPPVERIAVRPSRGRPARSGG